MSAQAGSAARKVTGGKLVRVDVWYGQQIEKVAITGDFFLYPEETLAEIENVLVGAVLPFDRGHLVVRIHKVVDDLQATLVGFTPQDLVELLEEAVK